MLSNPIKIGSLEVPNRVILAPLAGVSDVPFRRICRELGAGFTFVEMQAANAVIHATHRSRNSLARAEDEPMLGVQVTGATPEEISSAVKVLDERGFDLIDINMGCPVKKIVSRGWGCALLKDPKRVEQMVLQARSVTRKSLTVKVRLGYSRNTAPIAELVPRIANGAVDMLTIHGRTRFENYAVPVDYTGIRSGFEALTHEQRTRMVTVGNGDIMDPASARAMHDQTGCDAVMVSRGALGNPWIFRDILEDHPAPVSGEEWVDVVLRHLDYHESFYGFGSHTALTARKHLLWYVTGFRGTRRLREQLSVVEHLDDARTALREFVRELPRDAVRYQNEWEHRGKNTDPVDDPKCQMDRSHDRAVAEESI